MTALEAKQQEKDAADLGGQTFFAKSSPKGKFDQPAPVVTSLDDIGRFLAR